jgi:hypothetical protein
MREPAEVKTSRDILFEEMKDTARRLRNGNPDNLLDEALGRLAELPAGRLNEELLMDMNVFIRSVWNAHSLWKLRQVKKGGG